MSLQGEKVMETYRDSEKAQAVRSYEDGGRKQTFATNQGTGRIAGRHQKLKKVRKDSPL